MTFGDLVLTRYSDDQPRGENGRFGLANPEGAIPLGKLAAGAAAKINELKGSSVTVVSGHEVPNYYHGVLKGAGPKNLEGGGK